MQTPYVPQSHVPNPFNIPTPPHTALKSILLLAIFCLAFALYKDIPSRQASTPDLGCKGNPNSPALSSQQLQTLKKTIPGTPKSSLTLPVAYCPLPSVVVRAGTIASRDAFRISATDSPNGQPVWGIAMYESNRFAGFRILTE
jgi:hypothetical protein